MEFKSKNPNYKQYLQSRMQHNHFMHYLGLQITSIDEGSIEASLDLKNFHLQQNGFVHGGVVSTVADIVMGFAAYSLVPDGEGTVTSDLKVAYLRPGIGEKLIARGKVIKPGKQLYYCEADILCLHPEKGEILIARGYSTMCAVNHPVK